tara:strand:- start:863 stop:2308 length:1446 start_codon:yes stop_codon:yes gene_type:complete
MVFWRLVDNKVHVAGEVDKLGFEISEGLRIPDEYLEAQEFIVMRTCFGIGDWGIITALPRLLKQKYPNCKVFLPSLNLLKTLFSDIHKQMDPKNWSNPFESSLSVFNNNPYVDGFVDEIVGEVFHDHYRIYDNSNISTPLVEQILKFWQFDKSELKDSAPELYWSQEEQEIGDIIINKHTDGDFGCLLISDRYDYTQDELIIEKLKEHPIPYFYYTEKPLNQTDFNFIETALDLRHVPVRIQLYIKSKAVFNISNQCGTNHLISRYSKCLEVQRQFPLKHNLVRGIEYLDNPFKRNLLKGIPDKLESKTTTSRKWKADLIDFFNKTEYKSVKSLEVGSSLGHSTRILSTLFNEVTALDNLAERHEKSRIMNSDRNNINYRVMDVYSESWDFDSMDVVYIDCIHTYEHIKKDIDNALRLFNKPILIFDDYGLFPDLMQAIDEYIERGELTVLKQIGQYPGMIYPKTKNKILKGREGLICQSI